MNTGVEGGETANKLVENGVILKKGIPNNKARIIFAKGNFWGRTLHLFLHLMTPVLMKDLVHIYSYDLIPYDDLESLEKRIKRS